MNFKPLAGLAALLAASFINTGLARAQEEVRLTPIELVESKDTIDHITQADMERKTATNLWEALKGVLGVYRTTGPARNDGTISIRGSTRYQMGMFLDDIPATSVWRNEWDLNNTLLYDLESIEISKGYSSPLLATNNGLFGVVNLRTAKPTKELEFSAKYLNFFDRDLDDQGRFFATSIGTRQERFYLKATVTQNQRDFFTLPSSFTAAPNEDGGRRDNSDYRNRAVNLIAGWTPTEDVDIMFGFVRQSTEKGQPFDAAAFAHDQTWSKYVRWPEYETTRYYLNGNVNLDEKAHLKAVLYYDEYKDKVVSFMDKTLSQQGYFNNFRASGTYDQSAAGGQLAFDYTFNEANKLAVSAGYRRLSHKDFSDNCTNGTPAGATCTGQNATGSTTFTGNYLKTNAREDYWDFGTEYTLKPMDPLTLVFGGSYSRLTPKNIDTRQNISAQMEPFKRLDSQSIFNYQVGAFYDLTKNHELFATFAKKSRFGTMEQRYNRDNNTNEPLNPDLKPENALHYELGYRGLIQDWLKINSSLYYSDVKDVIYRFGGQGNPWENADKTKFYGFELGAEALFNQHLSAGLTFNYLEWDNDAKNREANLVGLPKVTSTVYAVVAPLEGLSIIPQVNMSSGFYWNNDPQNTRDPGKAYQESPGYATADLKVVYDLNEHLTFELGAMNIFDKEYAYSAYYPEPGRSFFLGLTAVY